MASGAGEKTERATPKRKQDERKKGNVFSSKDLVSAFYILIVFLTIRIFSTKMFANLTGSLVYWINITDDYTAFSQKDLKVMLVQAMGRITSYNVCYTKLLRPSSRRPGRRHSQRVRDTSGQ